MMPPMMIVWYQTTRPLKAMMFKTMARSTLDSIVLSRVPRPPSRVTPPMTAMAIAESSKPRRLRRFGRAEPAS